jgi:hypothetical protein
MTRKKQGNVLHPNVYASDQLHGQKKKRSFHANLKLPISMTEKSTASK